MLVFEKEGVHFRVGFPNRCFFCFVRVSSDFEQVSYDTSAGIHFPVNDFQQVFNHLLPENEFRFVEEAPPICAICGTLLEVLHNALNQLKSATVAVQSRTTNLGKDGINREQRLQDFILDLRKIPMGLELVQEAVNLLEKIGHGPFQDFWTTLLPQQGRSENFLEGTRNAYSCEGGPDQFTNYNDTKPEEFGWQIHQDLKLEEGTRETNSESKMSFEMDDFDMQHSADEASLPEEDVVMEEELISPVWAQEPDEADPLSDGRAASRLPRVAGLRRLEEVSMQERGPPQRSKEVKVESSHVDPDEWMEATMEESPVPKNKTGGFKDKMQTCDFCDQEVSVGSLLQHVRGHVGDYATTCPNPSCKRVFSNSFSLKRHSSGGHSKCQKLIGDRLSTCETCGAHFPSLIKLRHHLKAEHETSDQPFACPVSGCLDSFSVRQSVDCHLHAHTKAKITNGSLPSFQICAHCCHRFPEEKFQEHLITDHGYPPDPETTKEKNHIPKKKCGRPKGNLRTCDYCGDRVPIGVMLKHVRGHVGDYATPCPNPDCKLVFSNICARKEHTRASNSCRKFIEDLTTCETCGHQASDIPKLRVHLKADHETMEKNFACPVSGCSERFSVRQSVDCHLNVHTIAHTTNAAPPCFQTCPLCDNHFPQDKLQEHLTTDHGTPPDSILHCKHCPNLFPSMGKLVNHLDVHVPKGKKIPCDLCPAGGSAMHFFTLRKHYLEVHKVNSYDFICEHCSHPFTKRNAFQKHLKLRHSREPKQNATTSTDDQPSCQDMKEPGFQRKKFSKKICDYCGKQVLREDLFEHFKGHVGDFVLSCPNPTCGYLSATLRNMSKHFGRWNPSCAPFDTKAYSKCEQCGHQASHLLNLRGHLQLVHETLDKPYSCPVANCSERFTLRQSVYCHINLHAAVTKNQKLAPPSFQTCPECEQEVSLDEVRKHLETVHQSDSTMIVSCKYCPYLFLSRDKLVDHFAVHINSGTPVSCDMCLEETKYLHMIGLRSHYLTEHKVSSAREFVCDACSKSFYTQQALRYHRKIVHSGEKQSKTKFRCPECPEQEFRDEKTLMVHKIRYHGADPFKCQLCGKTFDSWHTFGRHEKEHKGTRKVYTCDIEGCGKTFKWKKGLEEHKMSVEHVGQTNAFVCERCGKGFNRKQNLKEHEKGIHGTERKFVCEECGESFKSTQILRRHKMIHTGEKPFQCDICQQRFRHKEVLRRHVEGHQKKGAAFRPNGPMKNVRKRVNPK